jgi:hypothetical protein
MGTRWSAAPALRRRAQAEPLLTKALDFTKEFTARWIYVPIEAAPPLNGSCHRQSAPVQREPGPLVDILRPNGLALLSIPAHPGYSKAPSPVSQPSNVLASPTEPQFTGAARTDRIATSNASDPVSVAAVAEPDATNNSERPRSRLPRIECRMHPTKPRRRTESVVARAIGALARPQSTPAPTGTQPVPRPTSLANAIAARVTELKDVKGDIALLQKSDGTLYTSVDFPTAERYAGVGNGDANSS